MPGNSPSPPQRRLTDQRLPLPCYRKVCAKQFAEISLSHQQTRNRLGLCIGEAVAHPFFSHEEEPLFTVGIEFTGNENRSPKREAELVIPKRRSEVRGSALIPSPGIG